MVKPTKGLLTYESEGQEGGPFHSRKLHVPSAGSGLTVGRGYDCRFKSKAKIKVDLSLAGLNAKDAGTIAKSAGFFGEKAKAFIMDNDLSDFEITKQQQVELFYITYREEAGEARRLCSKADVEKEYGDCNWDSLDPVVIDVLVDLKFRGDYTPTTRRLIQKYVAENDVKGLYGAISNRSYWSTVPQDRFDRRVNYMLANVPALTSAESKNP